MLFWILIFLTPIYIFSQDNNDELIVGINHTIQIPKGEMKNRFGNNSNLSGILLYKTKNNLIFNAELGFMFGSNVKENNLFEAIDGNEGVLISQNGEIPIIRLFQRGGNIDISCGKYLPINNKKHNGGLFFTIGTGYLYHKIFIETLTVELPQLSEELLKGYDRLCGGFLTKQVLGYLYFNKKNNIRLMIGLEFVQAFTKDLREYNYTTQSNVTQKRTDYLLGLKTGFIIPIKQRTVERYYYY